MITSYSRYADSEIVSVLARDGELTKSIRPPRWYAREFMAKHYTITEGERLEQLAYRFYDDPEMWWAIAVANPEIMYPDEIPGGTVIRIPSASSLR